MRHRRPYYVFASRDSIESEFLIEFGDFERTAVEFERKDWLEHLNPDGSCRKKSNTRVFRTRTADRGVIFAALEALNRYGDPHVGLCK